ncbi:MAG: thioredoxin domain-containing protein [Bacteroidetes bacterium]|nr:thioredoxin domain-containing protein [Bacteroidota bacterium]
MNRLSHESSPYLRQHAHNPVDWYAWGEEALNKARVEDKPLLVSIGYSTCHWCHVMERESFEDTEVAAFMNAHFINVKIDREERPDLDAIYMDAVQAMTGQGGWPLHVFLLPDAKPFYGGTYFPPRPVQGRASWKEVLTGVAKAYRERCTEMDAQAENLTTHLIESNRFGEKLKPEEGLFSEERLIAMGQTLLQQADPQHGGFGRPPKFPQSFSIRFLLLLGEQYAQSAARSHALFSLDRMIDGGIYDQVGGGFARYATDTEWLAPHFEKMLYDNALLVEALAEAYQVSGREKYRRTLEAIRIFLERELLHPDGGFYSALDADTEGEEGKFYVWTMQELQQLLEADFSIFSSYYEVLAEGNWKGVNILRVVGEVDSIALANNLSVGEVEAILARCRSTLLHHRAQRVRPGLDHKILLGWNALMQAACSLAYQSTGEESWKLLGERNMHFMVQHFRSESGEWFHGCTDGKKFGDAFLDDRAYLIRAWIAWHAATGEWKWLEQARDLLEDTVRHFEDASSPFFYFTSAIQTDLILRKKEIYDGALPSANAVMAENLLRLGTLFDRSDWVMRSKKMVSSLGQALLRYSGSFGYWCRVLSIHQAGLTEVALMGPESLGWMKRVGKLYLPEVLFLVLPKPQPPIPRFSDTSQFERTSVQVCRESTCLPPVFSPKDLLINLKKR